MNQSSWRLGVDSWVVDPYTRNHVGLLGKSSDPTGDKTFWEVILRHAQTCPQSIFSILFANSRPANSEFNFRWHFLFKACSHVRTSRHVQSVRNTRLLTPQLTFLVKFQGQKVKFSQILRFHYFDRTASPQSQKHKPI